MFTTPELQQPEPLDDEKILRQLGYSQQLHRRMGLFGNYAAALTTVSILSGALMLLGFGLNTGGPGTIMWVWIVGGLLMVSLSVALAEVASRYPTSGGLYYMARQLGGKRWSWYTGWLNLLGLLGGLAAQDFGNAIFVNAWLDLQWGIQPGKYSLFTICTAVLVLTAVLNLFSARLMNLLTSFCAWWIPLVITTIVVALAVVPSHHQSAEFVFTEFTNNTGWSSSLYVVLLASLLPAFALAGCDTSAHLSEETSQASVTVPRGMTRCLLVGWIAGGVLLAGVLFGIQDYGRTLSSPTGVPVAQVLIDALGVPFAKTLLLMIIVGQLLCGYILLGATSRMIYAFSRDGALPGSALWRRVSPRTATPDNATWLAVAVSFVLILPSLYSPTAFTAVTAISMLGWTPAYAIPVFLRLRNPHKFTPGPWTLGRWSRLNSWIAVVFGAAVTVMTLVPQVSPVSVSNLNYAPVALLVCLALSAGWWQVKRHSYGVPISISKSSASEQIVQAEEII